MPVLHDVLVFAKEKVSSKDTEEKRVNDRCPWCPLLSSSLRVLRAQDTSRGQAQAKNVVRRPGACFFCPAGSELLQKAKTPRGLELWEVPLDSLGLGWKINAEIRTAQGKGSMLGVGSTAAEVK